MSANVVDGKIVATDHCYSLLTGTAAVSCWLVTVYARLSVSLL